MSNLASADPAPPGARAIVGAALLFEGGLGLLAWILGWLFDQPPLSQIHNNLPDVALAAAATVPLVVGLWLITRYPVGPLRALVELVEEVIAPLFRDCTIVELALIALVAGVGEEMLFRGIVQQALADRLNPAAGIAVASLLFGLAHPITRTYVALAAIIGCYLGVLLLLTGNLLVPILVHGLYDFVALAYLVHRHRGRTAEEPSG